MAEPSVAPAVATAAAHEDDFYEDAGDLEFQNRAADGNANDNDRMFLVRLPVELWKSWSRMDDSEEIRIGTVRTWEEKETKVVGHGKYRRNVQTTANRFKMLLSPGIPGQEDLPREYDLAVTESAVVNTFLFTEQDLPNHRLKNKIKAEQQKAGLPQNLIRASWASQTDSRAEANGADDASSAGARTDRRGRRFTPYRKAVPKKTAVMGRVRYELNCAPVNNAESRMQLQKLVMEATAPKRVPKLMPISEIRGASGPTSIDRFDGFIKSAHKPVPKAKKQENKATRVPPGELRDMLNACFKRYNYWSMKALRQETQQPEAYLRENLELIADLHKSGSFANHWSLKAEYSSSNLIPGSTGEIAPDIPVDAEGSDEGENE